MSKLYNWIGSLIAFACLMEIASNPKQIVRDIQRGPMPHLAQFNDSLNHPAIPRVRSQRSVQTGNKLRPISD